MSYKEIQEEAWKEGYRDGWAEAEATWIEEREALLDKIEKLEQNTLIC